MLTEALKHLETVLTERAPKIHEKLAAGATDNQIEDLRKTLGGRSTPELEAWFRWHNGSTGPFTPLLPLGDFISIDELKRHRQMDSIVGINGQRSAAVKILDDGAGDGFFLSLSPDNPVVFYHMLEDPNSAVSYGSFTEFLKFVAGAWESEVLQSDELGLLAHDEDAYFKFAEKHERPMTAP